MTRTCRVTADRFTCELPAARIDFRLEAAGVAPFYVWEADLASNSTLDLGDVSLSSGASIAGWIETETRGFDLRTAAVKLVADAYRDSVKPNARGFFQFKNVPAGTYSIVAEAERATPARMSSLVVAKLREYVLETPLQLRPLARVELLVSPPVDPNGNPWTVRLERFVPMSSVSSVVASGPVSERGEWTSGNVEAGSHYVRILDKSGTAFERHQIEVEPDMPVIPIAILAVPVTGRVLVGDKPLRAKVRLWSLTSDGARVETDDDGNFECILASEGKWNVDVKPVGSYQSLLVKPVLIRRRDGEERARVEIKLPGGRVLGKVVDESGHPMKAGIRFTQAGVPSTDTRTNDDGEFELIGLDEGSALLEAVTKTAESGGVNVMIDADAASEITLTLRELRKITTVLTTTSGHPVAGAQISYWNPLLGIPRPAVSGPNGRFTIVVPATIDHVHLSAYAPGVPFTLTQVALPRDDNSVSVTVSDIAGKLAIHSGENLFWPIVHHQGAMGSFGVLRMLREFAGPPPWLAPGGIVIDVEPGEYTLCPTLSINDRCVTRTVVAGATTVVDATQWAEGR
ncbi:MAG TPA: carboxypeptidase-like regulatory domain-containing protein [Thermoanaerobaculia bacterium]|nr:carboxypeptidase-like regulatory domain-containing protein [Thermoanaerobaculia bacterium]